MRHFSFLSDEQRSRLFSHEPHDLDLRSPAPLLAAALGATLYCPGDRPSLVSDVQKMAAKGCVSMVLCLEDSISDRAVPEAEQNVVDALVELGRRESEGLLVGELPLLFVRVRTPEQLLRVADRIGEAVAILTGFVVPKFRADGGYGQAFLDALHEIRRGRPDDSPRLTIMPILESPEMIHTETRVDALHGIAEVLRDNRDDVLAVRIGATDLSSIFGLRRSRDLTIYDVKVVSSVISDVVNVLGRTDGGFVITGTVWEHFADTERLLRPQLRLTPFVDSSDEDLRRRLLLANFDGLMREIALDHANGLLGKTVIHPTHVPLVHAMSVISSEEYLDARAIAADLGGGAAASPSRNKMNEMKPHRAWAEKTLLRAAAFGVAAQDVTYVDLLEASMA
jgi:citrate lyase beta subunit